MRARKKCSAAKCNAQISVVHPFCRKCFSALPSAIRETLVSGYQRGDGQSLMQAKEEARQFLSNRYEENKMHTGKSDIVDVCLEPRIVKGAAQAFFQGDYDEDHNGNMKEKWVWLPLSQFEMSENNGDTVTVSLPEWLAHSKGLI